MAVTPSDVLTEEEILDRVIDRVEETMAFRQVYRNIDATDVNNDVIKLKKMGDAMADPEPIGPNSEFPEDEENASKVTIDIDEKYGKQVSLPRESQQNSIMDEIAIQVDAMARSMDEFLDKLAFNAVDDSVSNNGNVLNANSDGTFDYADAVEVRQELRGKNFSPEVLIIDPAAEGDLLNDSKFTHATELADEQVIREGQIGRVAGMDVVVQTHIDFANSPAAYCVDPNNLGFEVTREGISTNRYSDDDTHSTKLQIWTMKTFEVVQDDAVAKIEG